MRTYKALNGELKRIDTMKPVFAEYVNSVIDRAEKAGYSVKVAAIKDRAVLAYQATEICFSFSFSKGEDKETNGIGFMIPIRKVKGKVSDSRLRINYNCEWSPKALYI